MTRRRGRCADCGRDGLKISGSRPDGAGVCGGCYRAYRPKSRCEECGELRFPAVRAGGRSGSIKTLCSRCYRAERPKRCCDGCGRVRVINSGRAGHGAPSLCSTCYIRVQAEVNCDGCGRMAPAVVVPGGRTTTEQVLCARCYRHPRRTCGICGRSRRAALKATDTTPAVCPTCYQAPEVTCSRCGRHGRGRHTSIGGAPGCFRCILTLRLDELLTGPDGRIPPRLLPLREAILATNNPQAALSNIGRRNNLRARTVLTQIASGQASLSHETLDQHGPSRSIDYLRALLVAADALPERDEHLTRLEAFARTLAAAAHPDDKKIVALFARTYLLRRIRARLGGSHLQPGSAYRARQELAATGRFLTHLRYNGRALATCRQTDLDEWLANSRLANNTRTFLGWAIRNRRLPPLTIPSQIKTEPSQFTPDHHRWAQARRVLHDDTLTTADRVAALLVLLYAQHVSRIARLTRGHLHCLGGRVELSLGTTNVVLPEQIAELAAQLPIPPADGTIRHLDDGTWLFPGRHAGRPLHPTSLARRLTALGIEPRPDRNSALLDYARQLPPPVIGRLLGLAPGTVDRWANIAGGKWARYQPPASRDHS